MSKNIKFGKILIVIFLAILIWVWADLALDEQFSVSSATITIAKSTNPGLWVSFSDEPSISIRKIVLKGPGSRVADVRRRLNDGSLTLEVFLDLERERTMTGSGEYALNLLDFLKKNDQIKQLGLTAESCEPQEILVSVVGLVKKSLAVRCVDEARNPVKVASIKPAQVDMFVPEDWSGEKLTAEVQLTRREIEQARLSAVERTAYIKLAVGQIREAANPVKITMPLEADRLNDYTITTATLGFSLSANLQGKYKVEVANLDELIRAIIIKATPEAKSAYDEMRYQVILEIDDSDKDIDSPEPLRKELVYNFPVEYVRSDEIRLNQPPTTARFKLIALSSADIQPSP